MHIYIYAINSLFLAMLKNIYFYILVTTFFDKKNTDYSLSICYEKDE